MVKYTNGDYKVVKDGNFYRVMNGRKRVGSFQLLSQAIKYADQRETGVPQE